MANELTSEVLLEIIDLRIAQRIAEMLMAESRLGTIDPAYTTGRPKVTFDGESTMSTRTYTYLSPYTPAAGDRVQLDRVGSTWVIQGRVI